MSAAPRQPRSARQQWSRVRRERGEKRSPQQSGFTLVEVLAAVFLTSIVIAFAVASYVNLSNYVSHASEIVQEQLRTGSAVDYIARDLQGAYMMVKDPEDDPLNHPWFFVAESRYASEGSDRLSFTTRNRSVPGTRSHESSLGVVSYALHENGDEGYQLFRKVKTRLPSGLERDFPEPDDEEAQILAEGVEQFELLFLTNLGEWVSIWDSSTILEAGQLPEMVEIRLALATERETEDPDYADDPLEAGDLGEENPDLVTRQVKLPIRPIDFAVLLEDKRFGGRGDEDDKADSKCETMTVRECYKTRSGAVSQALSQHVVDIVPFLSANALRCIENIEDDLYYQAFQQACGNQ